MPHSRKYGVGTANIKEYDRVRGRAYRALHKKEALAYQKQYRKTIDGVITLMYSHMKYACHKRGHPMPQFTKAWLEEWLLLKNTKTFTFLFSSWVLSGYKKDLKPSVDRKNPEIGYTKRNIRLMTWRENLLGRWPSGTQK